MSGVLPTLHSRLKYTYVPSKPQIWADKVLFSYKVTHHNQTMNKYVILLITKTVFPWGRTRQEADEMLGSSHIVSPL